MISIYLSSVVVASNTDSMPNENKNLEQNTRRKPYQCFKWNFKFALRMVFVKWWSTSRCWFTLLTFVSIGMIFMADQFRTPLWIRIISRNIREYAARLIWKLSTAIRVLEQAWVWAIWAATILYAKKLKCSCWCNSVNLVPIVAGRSVRHTWSRSWFTYTMTSQQPRMNQIITCQSLTSKGAQMTQFYWEILNSLAQYIWRHLISFLIRIWKYFSLNMALAF